MVAARRYHVAPLQLGQNVLRIHSARLAESAILVRSAGLEKRMKRPKESNEARAIARV
jgi:hypothetical protein